MTIDHICPTQGTPVTGQPVTAVTGHLRTTSVMRLLMATSVKTFILYSYLIVLSQTFWSGKKSALNIALVHCEKYT